MTVISQNPTCVTEWCCCNTSFKAAIFSVSGVQTEPDFPDCTPSQGRCGLFNDSYYVELESGSPPDCGAGAVVYHKCIKFTCTHNNVDSYMYLMYQASAFLDIECDDNTVTLISRVGIEASYLDGSFGCPPDADLCVLYNGGDSDPCIHGSPFSSAAWKREVTLPRACLLGAPCGAYISGVHIYDGSNGCELSLTDWNFPEEINVTYIPN
jgi:hypothetical protein